MINFIKNIWHFRKFLWENRWWDYYFIFFMLREKLKVDVKYYKKYSLNKYAQDQIMQMKLCIKILKRINDDNYLENALFFFEKEYPNWMKNLNSIADEKWYKRCISRADKQKQQDIEYLFKYLCKHIQNWWD